MMMVSMTCQVMRYHGTARSHQDPQSAEPRQSQGSLVLSSKIMSSLGTIDLPGRVSGTLTGNKFLIYFIRPEDFSVVL